MIKFICKLIIGMLGKWLIGVARLVVVLVIIIPAAVFYPIAIILEKLKLNPAKYLNKARLILEKI